MNTIKLNLANMNINVKAINAALRIDTIFNLGLSIVPEKRALITQRLAKLNLKQLGTLMSAGDAGRLNGVLSKAGLNMVRVGEFFRIVESSKKPNIGHLNGFLSPQRQVVAEGNFQNIHIRQDQISLFSAKDATGGSSAPEEFWHKEVELKEDTIPFILFKTVAKALPKNWNKLHDLTMEKAWELYMRYPYNTITYALENKGFLSPFRNVDPDDMIKDWVSMWVAPQRSIKQKLVIMIENYLLESRRDATSSNKMNSWGISEERMNLILCITAELQKINNIKDTQEKDLKLAFFFVAMCNAMKINSGLAIAGGRIINWIEIDGEAKKVDLNEREYLEQFVDDAVTRHLMSDEVLLPNLTDQKISASQAFAGWQVMRAKDELKRSPSEIHLVNAESLCLVALEIDNAEIFQALRVLKIVGFKMLRLRGFNDIRAAIEQYLQGSLDVDKIELLKRMSNDHISVRIALQSISKKLKKKGKE